LIVVRKELVNFIDQGVSPSLEQATEFWRVDQGSNSGNQRLAIASPVVVRAAEIIGIVLRRGPNALRLDLLRQAGDFKVTFGRV